MAKFKPDLRKVFRAEAAAVQDENAERLLSGQAVSGGTIAPKAAATWARRQAGRRRVRVLGVRVNLSQIGGKPGIGKGDMLRELTKRSNAKVTRTGFKISL